MKKRITYSLICFLMLASTLFAQESQDSLNRIENIRYQLEELSKENTGLQETVKSDISVTNITLGNFLMAISDIHQININVSPALNQINLVNNFTNVTVSDLLVYLCKEYSLTIEFTGNILSIKKFEPPLPPPEIKEIPITYFPSNDLISLDLNNDPLYKVFKKIIDESGKNLVFSPDLQNKQLTAYIQETPFKVAMDKLAYANNLYVEETKDGFYLFESNQASSSGQGSTNSNYNRNRTRTRKGNYELQILDTNAQLLKVDFNETPIENIIYEVADKLDLDIFTATPLSQAGTISLKADKITFEELLTTIFEVDSNLNNSGNASPVQNNNQRNSSNAMSFTYKREGNMYFFGTDNQLSVRQVEIIKLAHRSVELLAGPAGARNTRSAGRNSFTSGGSYSNYNNYNNSANGGSYNNRNREQVNTNSSSNSFQNYESKAEALISILPEELKKGLDIKIDFELNSFYVNGPSENIKRFKGFIDRIDQPVPVVLIEVMIIEVSKSATVETGISWGIGNEPVETRGRLFPTVGTSAQDFTLSSETINKVIGGFDGFGSFNIGKVVPNFYATIRAMEANGNLKIRSTPKLSTLNGHRASFSNGQTSYYTVTQRNIYGTDNPQTSEITNYVPIDAELGINIKPLVSGDGQVTLDIFVVQSSFGSRVEENAPPDISSREFSSIIRVEDQDIVVLGGLEEQVKDDSGSGVPLLSRIPIIKWLFSSRRREDSKSKLTVLIKPTIIY